MFFNSSLDSQQYFFIIVKNNKIIHVTDVAAASQFFFDIMVHSIKINVCKKLRGQISNGDANLNGWKSQNGSDQAHCIRTRHFSLNQPQQDRMVDTWKVFLDITFQNITFGLCKLLKTIDSRLVGSFCQKVPASTARVLVRDKN